MNKLVQSVKQFMNDEEGATAIEYGLFAALIAVVIIAAVKAVGLELNVIFGEVETALKDR